MAFFSNTGGIKQIPDFISDIKPLNIPSMGVPMSMHVFERGSHDGNTYLPSSTYKSFPVWRSRPAGMLVAYYNALPPGLYKIIYSIKLHIFTK